MIPIGFAVDLVVLVYSVDASMGPRLGRPSVLPSQDPRTRMSSSSSPTLRISCPRPSRLHARSNINTTPQSLVSDVFLL